MILSYLFLKYCMYSSHVPVNSQNSKSRYGDPRVHSVFSQRIHHCEQANQQQPVFLVYPGRGVPSDFHLVRILSTSYCHMCIFSLLGGCSERASGALAAGRPGRFLVLWHVYRKRAFLSDPRPQTYAMSGAWLDESHALVQVWVHIFVHS